MFGPGFIHFTQPSYVQKSAEIYLANLTNLALMPNFPFRFLHPRKGFVRMPHATMGSQTNVASVEFKFLCSILPLVDSLKSPTTFGSYHGHLWLARNALGTGGSMLSGDQQKWDLGPRSPCGPRPERFGHWASASSWHWELPWARSKTQHCHTLHRPFLHSGVKHISCMFLTPPFFGMHRGGWCDVSISPVWMGKTTRMEEYVCYTCACQYRHIVCTWNHIGSFKQFQC